MSTSRKMPVSAMPYTASPKKLRANRSGTTVSMSRAVPMPASTLSPRLRRLTAPDRLANTGGLQAPRRAGGDRAWGLLLAQAVAAGHVGVLGLVLAGERGELVDQLLRWLEARRGHGRPLLLHLGARGLLPALDLGLVHGHVGHLGAAGLRDHLVHLAGE